VFNSIVCNAQETQSGILPFINLSGQIQNELSFNVKIESRQFLYQDKALDYDYNLTDIGNVISYKFWNAIKLSMGYMLRIEGDNFEHRSIQQLTKTFSTNSFKVSWRLRTDQTFGASKPEYRIRARIALQKPFNGNELNNKEYYLKLTHEMLNDWKGRVHDLDLRLLGFVGYKLDDNQRLEFGVDTRFDKFINNELRSNIWGSIGYYVNID
jgi:hypothetical protein